MEYEQFCKKIGGLIRTYRVRRGYSLRDFANEMNVQYQHIQKLENGDNLPLFFNMLRITEILEIPGNDIFGKGTDGIDLQELSRKYKKYDDIINLLDDSKELRELVRYYKKNRSKLETINVVNAIDSATKIPRSK